MKFNGKYIGSLFDANGDLHITFKVPRFNARGLDLSEDTDYRLDINKVKSKRSIQANNYLWALLGQLEDKSGEDSWSWYIKSLDEADAKFTYRFTPDDEKEIKSMKTEWRAAKLLGKRTLITAKGDEVELLMFKCYYGSSKFNTDEMTKLLDIVIGWCHEYNIEHELYKYE